jgi:hypothetical protein
MPSQSCFISRQQRERSPQLGQVAGSGGAQRHSRQNALNVAYAAQLITELFEATAVDQSAERLVT